VHNTQNHNRDFTGVSEGYDGTVSGGQTQAVIWVFSEMVFPPTCALTYEQHYNKENKWGYRTS